MKEHFRESINDVKSISTLVIAIALLNAIGASRILLNLQQSTAALLGGLFSTPTFILYTVSFGRLSERVQGHERKTFFQVLKKYWWKYLATGICLFLPLIVLTIIFAALLFHDSPDSRARAVHLLSLMYIYVYIAAIYVFPYVFLNNTRKGAIRKGISFLLRNLRLSTPLILASILLYAISLLIYRILPLYISENVIAKLLIHLTIALAAILIHFVVFSMACRVFVNKRLAGQIEP